MSAPVPIPPSRPRRRGTVEVYFLLYLSAIILLLGTTQGGNDRENLDDTVRELLAPGFRVEVEKPALLWRFVPAGITPDSIASMALEQDSTNIITAYGTVADLRFDIVEIEDTISGRSLPAEAASLTRVGERSAVFRWQPAAGETLENRVYRVTVSATGRPIPPPDLRPETRRIIDKILDEGGTVGDSVTFTVNLLSINNRGNGPITDLTRRPDSGSMAPKPPDTVFITNPTPSTLTSLPALDIRVANMYPEVLPGKRWNNSISVVGPTGGEIVWNVSGPGRKMKESQTGLEVEGTLPVSGDDQVITVTARRTSDGATATTNFRVSRASDDDMRIPPIMYAGESYMLDVAGPSGPNTNLEVTIRQGNLQIGRHSGQSKIRFNPTIPGTVTFTRKINGAQKVVTATVEPLPPPVVRIADHGDDEAIIQTIAYGSPHGTPNFVSLKILKGNARDAVEIPERRQSLDKESGVERIQFWRVARESAGEFEFTMQAIDGRGSGTGKSIPVAYP